MCYSDHNEDIRTKGHCDYCRSAVMVHKMSDLPLAGEIVSENLGRLFD